MRSGAWTAAATIGVLLSALAVALIAATPESPITPFLYPGSGSAGWLEAMSMAVGLDELPRRTLALLALGATGLVGVSFAAALHAAWNGRLRITIVAVVAVGLHLLALAMPLIVSRDAHSYAMYGRMVAAHGANPYVEVPASFASDPAFPLVAPDWAGATSAYGPGFTLLSAGVTTLAGSPAAEVFAFRSMAAAASLGTAALVAAAARRLLPGRRAFAVLLVAWNPVVLFHGVAGGHNDTLLALAVAAGVLCILAERARLGTVFLALGTLVKVSGAVPLVMGAIGAAMRRRSRIRELALHAAIAAAVAVPFVLPFLQTENPTLGVRELAAREGWIGPSSWLISLLRPVVEGMAGSSAAGLVSPVVRGVLLLVFVWAVVRISRYLIRKAGDVTAADVLALMGWTAVIALLAAPLVLPWYLIWALPLAWFLPAVPRNGVILCSVVMGAAELIPEFRQDWDLFQLVVTPVRWTVGILLLVVLAWCVVDLARRSRDETDGCGSSLLADDVRTGELEPTP